VALFDLLERLDQASLQAQRKLTIPFLKETLGCGPRKHGARAAKQKSHMFFD
jgi:hypothetical protein